MSRPRCGRVPLTVAAVASAYELQPDWALTIRRLGRRTRLSLAIHIDGQLVVLERISRRQAANLAGTIMRRLRRVAPCHHPRPLPANGDAYRRRRRQATRRRQ